MKTIRGKCEGDSSKGERRFAFKVLKGEKCIVETRYDVGVNEFTFDLGFQEMMEKYVREPYRVEPRTVFHDL